MSTTRRFAKPPPISLPLISFPDEDSFYTDSIEEIPEYDAVDLNLGAESPSSILNAELVASPSASPGSEAPRKGASDDQWAKAGIAVHTNVPPRLKTWRSNSFSEKQKKKPVGQKVVDRDCGICFEVAVTPCRTLCCGKLFCLEHITDWLHGSSADGRCPSCKTPCTFENNILSLASPTRKNMPVMCIPVSPPSSPFYKSGSMASVNDSETHLVLSPVATKPPPQSSLLFFDQESANPLPSLSPSISLSSASSTPSSTSSSSVTHSPSTSSSARPSVSMRQRHSPSYPFPDFNPTFSPEDGAVMLPVDDSFHASTMFSSPSTAAAFGRVAGRLLSLIGLTLVFYVLLT